MFLLPEKKNVTRRTHTNGEPEEPLEPKEPLEPGKACRRVVNSLVNKTLLFWIIICCIVMQLCRNIRLYRRLLFLKTKEQQTRRVRGIRITVGTIRTRETRILLLIQKKKENWRKLNYYSRSDNDINDIHNL